jgi:hypothetical protein
MIAPRPEVEADQSEAERLSEAQRFYTPRDIAEEVGQTPRNIREYLRERFPRRFAGSWWRLSRAEYENALRELQTPRDNAKPGKRRRRGCIRSTLHRAA